MGVPVLDASALLAYIRQEPGYERVRDAIAEGAAISVVNVAEALSVEAAEGIDPAQLTAELRRVGVLGGALAVHGMTEDDAVEAARLRPLTKAAGLSLGDRICVALTRRLDGVALSADRPWQKAKLDVAVELIR
ncbi:MAG TPA: type II toxin-antitoxin system VapC family toxin [Solirubrobacteraceae bacterium]|nr:type II toxin-antitoxin system VapC family toxin [Solirubrobacteraceae bacterium]